MRYYFALALLLSTPATAATSDAFGLSQGQAENTLKIHRKTGRHSYEVRVPSPLSEFTSYQVAATPKTGVCKVVGVGRTRYSGEDLKRAFDRLSQDLSRRYGHGERLDVLKPSSTLRADTQWLDALRKGDRTLSLHWDRSEGSSMPSSIETVMLDVNALNARGATSRCRLSFAISGSVARSYNMEFPLMRRLCSWDGTIPNR